MDNEELCTLARNGDESARDELIRRNMKLAFKIANEVLDRERKLNRAMAVEAEDLAQEGAIAMTNCIKLYNRERGVKFITYAAKAIRNAMQSYINKQEKPANKREKLDLATLFQESETRERLYVCLDKLPERDRVYFSYRFGLDQGCKKRSRNQTAEHFGISLARAKQTEQLAEDRLLAYLHGKVPTV